MDDRTALGASPAPRFFLPRRMRLGCNRRRWRRLLVVAALLGGAFATASCAARFDRLQPNLSLPTLEGRQFWTDVAWDSGWRVQRHAWTGHGRLLDGEGVRRAWGGEAACRRRLEEMRRAGSLDDPRRDTVVLVHGLARSHASLATLGERLEKEGYDVVPFEYASTRAGVEEHGRALAHLLEGLPGNRRVSFVTHSLGGLVVRSACTFDGWRGRHAIGRVATLAAPHEGAAVAGTVRRVGPVRWILGPSLSELADGTAARLPAPPTEVLAVAAVRGSEEGWNPWVGGDDDGLVASSEALPSFADERLVVEGLHTFVMEDEDVIEAVVAFLAGTELDDCSTAGPRGGIVEHPE